MADKAKNTWVEGVMGSLQGIDRALPGDALFSKIEQKLEAGLPVTKLVPIRMVTYAAACIAILLVLNLTLLKGYKNNATHHGDNLNAVIEYYGLTNDEGGFEL